MPNPCTCVWWKKTKKPQFPHRHKWTCKVHPIEKFLQSVSLEQMNVVSLVTNEEIAVWMMKILPYLSLLSTNGGVDEFLKLFLSKCYSHPVFGCLFMVLTSCVFFCCFGRSSSTIRCSVLEKVGDKVSLEIRGADMLDFSSWLDSGALWGVGGARTIAGTWLCSGGVGGFLLITFGGASTLTGFKGSGSSAVLDSSEFVITTSTLCEIVFTVGGLSSFKAGLPGISFETTEGFCRFETVR